MRNRRCETQPHPENNMKKIGFLLAPLFLLSSALLAQAPAAPAATPAAPPAPCGPAAQLSDTLATNVAADSRCFELRMYTAQAVDDAPSINTLHQRFREAEIGIFQRLGAEIVAVWQRMDDPNTLVWMLAYRDRAHRDEVWAAFRTDPEWVALLEKYPVPLQVQSYMLSTTDYSPLK
jgi:hypothetical protein